VSNGVFLKKVSLKVVQNDYINKLYINKKTHCV